MRRWWGLLAGAIVLLLLDAVAVITSIRGGPLARVWRLLGKSPPLLLLARVLPREA